MEQLLAHLIGDYVLQNKWMGWNKGKKSWICLCHVLLYTSVFLFLTTSWQTLLFIGVTHFLIDRFRLPLYIIRLKEPTGIVKNFGYDEDVPEYIAFWLYVITDNTLHLLLNYFALKHLG